jgi:hypothetical protein
MNYMNDLQCRSENLYNKLLISNIIINQFGQTCKKCVYANFLNQLEPIHCENKINSVLYVCQKSEKDLYLYFVLI